MRRSVLLLLSILCCLAATGGVARAEQADYALRILGFRLGTLSYAAEQSADSYAARLVFRTGGFAGLIAAVRFDAEAEGRVRPDGGLAPRRYREESLRGSDREVTEILWTGSRPEIVVEDPPQPDRLNAEQALGSVDLMTGLHLIFRPVPRDGACRAEADTYDGKRVMSLSLARAGGTDAAPRCAGTFTRIAGVPPSGMLDIMSGGFTVTYAPLPDGRLRVERMDLQTPIGPAAFVLD